MCKASGWMALKRNRDWFDHNLSLFCCAAITLCGLIVCLRCHPFQHIERLWNSKNDEIGNTRKKRDRGKNWGSLIKGNKSRAKLISFIPLTFLFVHSHSLAHAGAQRFRGPPLVVGLISSDGASTLKMKNLSYFFWEGDRPTTKIMRPCECWGGLCYH